MIDIKDKSQILQHLEKALNVTIYDTKYDFVGIMRVTR
jgi:hypothetical protein